MTPKTTEPDCNPSQLVSLSIREASRRLGTFALVLEGDQLAPRYRDGDVLIVDAAARPEPGDAVIVETRAGYGAMLLNGDGDATDNHGGYLPASAFILCGVVAGVCPVG